MNHMRIADYHHVSVNTNTIPHGFSLGEHDGKTTFTKRTNRKGHEIIISKHAHAFESGQGKLLVSNNTTKKKVFESPKGDDHFLDLCSEEIASSASDANYGEDDDTLN